MAGIPPVFGQSGQTLRIHVLGPETDIASKDVRVSLGLCPRDRQRPKLERVGEMRTEIAVEILIAVAGGGCSTQSSPTNAGSRLLAIGVYPPTAPRSAGSVRIFAMLCEHTEHR